MEDAAVVAPIFWHAVLGQDNTVYKTASTYAYRLPELKAHVEQQRVVHNDELREERRVLMQDRLSNKHMPYKITEHLRWRREECDIKASCVFFGLAYVPPEPFERNMPLKWRWPTQEQRCNESLAWVRRWNFWIHADKRRRDRLQQSIDSVTQRTRQEKLREQWFLLGEEEQALIVQSKQQSHM